MLTTAVHPSAYQAAAPQRVAIAGTVINAATQEGLPQVVVRITQAPVDCIQRFLTILENALADHPQLMIHYQRRLDGRPPTVETLSLAQSLFNTFEHNQRLVAPRPDQTLTGGDGHYCFFDLPPGDYSLTATLAIPHVCQGVTQGRVRVLPSDQWLAFSALDLTLSLATDPPTLPVSPLGDPMPWPSFASLHQAQLALSGRS
ncbi:carboxypeptidase-like regulatory domain-containing protein [Phormidium sp. FACHB-1136]|uniref:carboxypeptidase-like regulatory domain-containing protein n=1 Tax=Phormidium sp. FACHB-1136 TaxID=2692848 RepID=UPI001683E51C|nr:carboxypeptidase-like regulatory domain-containing protein [Phormidium sp. FACHB-1136]MBD2425238.1 carboxypeptidase regulatory-like domain-containing protein [Phormidium sp. FACHB-1136]